MANLNFNKIKKVIYLVTGIVFLGLIGRCFYMVACISCSTLAIKVYEYPGSMDQCEKAFRSFAKVSPDIKYEITRRGEGQYDARDLIIYVNKKNIPYMTYSLVIHDFNGATEVDLQGIRDEVHNSGGDSNNKYASKELFEKFKAEFLPRLESHDISLKPNFFNF